MKWLDNIFMLYILYITYTIHTVDTTYNILYIHHITLQVYIMSVGLENYNEQPCDLVHGCENNGICHNTCTDFWCDCPVPYTNGKRCEGCKYSTLYTVHV